MLSVLMYFYLRADGPKLEQSFVNFCLHHPKWKPAVSLNQAGGGMGNGGGGYDGINGGAVGAG